MNKARKIIIISICSLLLFISFSMLFGVIYIAAFSEKNIDSLNDERLFALAKNGSYTEYYVSEDVGAVSLKDYKPILNESLALGETKKEWVALSEINKHLIDGFIAIEDRKFYDHQGVDLLRTLYAAFNSVFHIKSTFGASTITQQVVKNLSGDNEVTFKRKLSEIIRAYNIESNHSKDEILEVYLNIVPMGDNIYGVGVAAEEYFAKSVSELTVAECATLIGITNAPTRYNPYKATSACIEKRDSVLAAMYSFGSINKKEYEQAQAQPLSLIPKAEKNTSQQSWFVETVNEDVINALCEKLGLSEVGAKKLLYNGGLKIYTTQSTAIQNILEDYFENENNFPKEIKNGLEYSMVLTDSSTGNLLAIVGSAGNKRGDKLLNMATALHTPGSSLKPLALYAPLIDSGKINWATVFDDVPLDFISSKSGELIEYPQNYPKRYDGLINTKDAIRLSKNTVAMKLYGMLDDEEIYYNLKYNFGFDTILRKGYNDNGNVLTDLAPAPLALGQLTYGISLRKLTEAYTVFPSDGVLSKGRSFIAVLDSDGYTIIDNSPEEKRVFSKACAQIMNKLLMNVTDSGTASSLTIKGAIDTAGKTGTSGDDKDRLFIGYTPYVTAGIWCGYRDNSHSIGTLSVSHLGIWDDVMLSVHKQLLRGKKDHEILSFATDGIKRYEYCKDSGMLFSPACAKDPRGSRLEYGFFLPNDKPILKCDRHVLCLYDKETEALATKGCPEENLTEISLIRFNGRSFPKEITVTDAEYMFYDIDGSCALGDSYDVPYYINYIPTGEYVGIGRRKKQFNSTCYLHND